jgi:hypothetical protein
MPAFMRSSEEKSQTSLILSHDEGSVKKLMIERMTRREVRANFYRSLRLIQGSTQLTCP